MEGAGEGGLPFLGGGQVGKGNDTPLGREALPEKENKEEEAHEGEHRPEGGGNVPLGVGIGVVGIAAGHARQAQEVLGKESEINAQEHNKEMGFGPAGMEGEPGKEGEPVMEGGEKGKDGPHAEDIMEMGNYVIGVMEDNVKGGVG